MYDSNRTSVLLDDETKSERTEILRRLYGMGFNLIPMNGKKPCVEWKPYQTRQVTVEEIKEWMRGFASRATSRTSLSLSMQPPREIRSRPRFSHPRRIRFRQSLRLFRREPASRQHHPASLAALGDPA